MELGEYIQKARLKLGMTYKQLSEQTGLTRIGLTKIINGKVKKPHPATMKKIIDALGLDLDETYKIWNEQ